MNLQILFIKDLKEIVKTYRIYVIPAVFLFFGFSSPIIAYFLPELIDSMAGEIEIIMPTPTWQEAFGEYFSNLTQLGLLAVILTFMGSVSAEKNSGIIQMILAKPVSRYSFVFSKLFANCLLLIVSVFISYWACFYSTIILFPEVNLNSTLLASVIFLVYALFIASLTIAASAVTRSNILAGGIALGGFVISSILPVLHPFLAEYSPGALQQNLEMVIAGSITFSDLIFPVLITLLLSTLLVYLGAFILNRQEL